MRNQGPSEADLALLDQFLALELPDRENFLRREDEPRRRAIFALWAKSPKLDLDEVLGLPSGIRPFMVMHLIGNGKMGIRPCGRSFVVGLAEPPKTKKERESFPPVMVEDGTENNRRQWLIFDGTEGPQMLECRKALNCLIQYGAHAESEHQRGRLRQYSQEEVAQFYASQAA